MNRVRVVRALAGAGAVTLVAIAFLPTATARPTARAAATALTYSGKASAIGVHLSIDESPNLVPVSDLFDVQAPQATSQFGSSGISHGTAALATPGNAAAGLALLCSAAAQVETLCETLNNITSKTPIGPYPPSNPFTANASYPEDNGKVVNAKVSGKQFGVGNKVNLSVGVARAQATPERVTSFATGLSAGLAKGTPIAVSTGTTTTSTSETVNNGVLVVTAKSAVQNVSIGGLVRIGAISSIAKVTNDGHGHVTHHGSTTITGVKVAGQSATIDNHGISIGGQGDHGAVLKLLNQTLQQALKTAGLTIQLAGLQVSKQGKQINVDGGGLLVNFEHPVKGLPNLAQLLPICVPSKSSCLLSPPNLNAKYIGIAGLGQVDVSAYATPAPPPPPPPSTTTTPPSPAPSTSIGPAGGGGPGNITPPNVPGAGTSPPGPGQTPEFPHSRTVNAGDVLTGTSNRLKYLFPAFLLAVIAGFGGGLFRHPARLPHRD
ncbi:MAG TPA: choice-of-anchor P family protein [Mycobacteriales bacterium]|nr:choice-of-anchor P family protein [Mycobacteriales bacterium]